MQSFQGRNHTSRWLLNSCQVSCCLSLFSECYGQAAIARCIWIKLCQSVSCTHLQVVIVACLFFACVTSFRVAVIRLEGQSGFLLYLWLLTNVFCSMCACVAHIDTFCIVLLYWVISESTCYFRTLFWTFLHARLLDWGDAILFGRHDCLLDGNLMKIQDGGCVALIGWQTCSCRAVSGSVLQTEVGLHVLSFWSCTPYFV